MSVGGVNELRHGVATTGGRQPCTWKPLAEQIQRLGQHQTLCKKSHSAYASRVIFEEEARGGFFDPALIGYSGLELMRLFLGAIREGRGTPPPIHHLTGVIPTEAGPGMSTFRMPASGWLATPAGVFLGATIGIPADGALGTAIQTTLPPATAYTTQELTLNYLRPASTDSEVLVARGRLVHLGRSLGLSEVIVEDANGRTLGHGSSRCFIFEPIRPAPEPPESYEFPDFPTYETPDPYLRPVEGEIWPDEVWKEMSGLEIYKAAAAGELGPRPSATSPACARSTRATVSPSGSCRPPRGCAARWGRSREA